MIGKLKTATRNMGLMMISMSLTVVLISSIELAMEVMWPTLSGVRALDQFFYGGLFALCVFVCMLIMIECVVSLVKGIVQASKPRLLIAGVICGLGLSVILFRRLPGVTLGYWEEVAFIFSAAIFSLSLRLKHVGRKA